MRRRKREQADRVRRVLVESASSFDVGAGRPGWPPAASEAGMSRNYPAAWIGKTIELLRIMDAWVVVEIGSTRIPLTSGCLEYFAACCPWDSGHYTDAGLESCATDHRPSCCAEGHSTYFWARAGFDTYTVDIDEGRRDTLTAQYADLGAALPPNLHIHASQDGIEFLEDCDHEIDFLYLDGWDVGSLYSAELHLEAFIAAEPALAERHLVSIDDADFAPEVGGGKDRLLGTELLARDYVEVLSGRQRVFLAPTR